MVGHLHLKGLTEAGIPASLSPDAMRYLRSRAGDDTVIVTDSLSMGATTSALGIKTPAAAVRALTAGADLALVCSGESAGPDRRGDGRHPLRGSRPGNRRRRPSCASSQAEEGVWLGALSGRGGRRWRLLTRKALAQRWPRPVGPSPRVSSARPSAWSRGGSDEGTSIGCRTRHEGASELRRPARGLLVRP